MTNGKFLSEKLTKKQRNALSFEGVRGEIRAEKWLEKHGFRIIESHKGKRSASHYDIKAEKGKDRWVIEVKTGEKPQIKIANLKKMLQEKGYNKLGLALVTKDDVYLLEYKKMTHAGYVAARTRKRKEAANKAWETRRRG